MSMRNGRELKLTERKIDLDFCVRETGKNSHD